MYLGYQNEKIKFYTEHPLDTTLYNITRIVETQDEYVQVDDEWVINDEKVKQNEIQKRQKNFETNFLQTTLGWYRQKPNGYSNAVQSIDVINNLVSLQNALTSEVAALIKFYKKPDFSKEEECSEKWLIENSYSPQPMTKEQWNTFYIEFQTKWAMQNYNK